MDGRWLAFLVAGAAAGVGVAANVNPHQKKTGSPSRPSSRSGQRPAAVGSAVRVGPRLCKKVRNRDAPVRLEQVLVLSTAHLSKVEAERLDHLFPLRLIEAYPQVAADRQDLETVISFQTEYGWFVYSAAEDSWYDLMANGPDQMPVLARVLRFARSLGASWVNFDCDAGTVAELDVFDW